MSIRTWIVFALVTTSLSFAAHAAPKKATTPVLKTAADVVARYDEIMSPAAFTATLAMKVVREDGTTRSYVMKTQKQGTTHLRATFQEPASARGQEMLRVDENLWSYVPNLKRAVRVASRDSFMGGDFNNSDIVRVNYVADYTAVLVDDADASVICAQLTAKHPGVAYDQIRLCLTRADAQPSRASYFAQSGKLLRSAVFSDVKDFGNGLLRPSTIVMKNEVQTARQSTITWTAFAPVDAIPASRFVVEDLGR
jgi:hypothetical protein